jgi:hypothetical protein
MGTGPVYMLASALYRMTRPPRLLGGIAMLWGYAKAAILRQPRYEDPNFGNSCVPISGTVCSAARRERPRRSTVAKAGSGAAGPVASRPGRRISINGLTQPSL